MVKQVLSADSHILEPPDLWTTRMQVKFRDRAPRLVHELNGQTGDFLVCEGLRPFNPTSLGSAGIPPEQHEQFFRGVPEDEQALILGGNMVRVYNLQSVLA